MGLVRAWRRLSARVARVVAVAVAAAVVLSVAVPLAARAQFPINEPFRTSMFNNTKWVLTGSPEAQKAHLTDSPPGDGWLELTSAEKTTSGAAVLNDPFPATYGIAVQFQYADYGGTKPEGADGFSFFLVNGSFEASTGGSGGGLGYTNGTNPSGHGIEGGYVGVGFDEYGNFSLAVPGETVASPNKRQPQRIVVRGPESQHFPYLAGEPAPGGTVETGNATNGVRTVRITIIDHDGHPVMSVFSNTGENTSFHTVINDLELTAPLPETFKLGFAASTGEKTNIHEIRDLTVGVPADVSIEKEGPEEVTPGGHIEYTLLVNGNGPTSLTNAVVHDLVPPEVHSVSWTCRPTSPGGFCVFSAVHTGNDVTVRVSFPNDHGVGSVEIVISGVVDPAATDGMNIINTATVTLPPDRILAGPTHNVSTETTTVDPTAETGSANLVIDKTVDNPRPLLGQDVTFTVTVTNDGPDGTADTVVRDELPPGLDFVSDDAAATGTTYEPLGGVWSVGALADRESKTLRITASAQNTAPAVNRVTFAQSERRDPSPCDLTTPPTSLDCGPAVTVTTRFADLKLAKTATPATTAPGGTVTYHLAVTNTGDAPATGVTLIDKLPPQVSYVSDDSRGTYHPDTGTWDVGDLDIGQTKHLDITVIAHATSENTIVEAISNLPDPDPCLPLPHPSLPPPQVTRPYGCPAPAIVPVVPAPPVPTPTVPTVPVTG